MKHQILILLLFFFVICACFNCEHSYDQPHSSTKSEVISKNLARNLINAYQDSDTSELDFADFFYSTGYTRDTSRIISFQLENAPLSSFIDQLGEMINDSSCNAQIRFHMAFDTTVKAGLTPLLEIVCGCPDSLQQDSLYKLKVSPGDSVIQYLCRVGPTESSACDPTYHNSLTSLSCDTILPPCDSIVSCNTLQTKAPPISPPDAVRFISNWQHIPYDSIKNTLYIPPLEKEDTSRVLYYTFNTVDSKEMYKYLKSINNRSQQPFLYLHLGICTSPCTIPLRTILHGDDKPLSSSIPSEEKPLLEFSYPCPRLCGDRIIGTK